MKIRRDPPFDVSVQIGVWAVRERVHPDGYQARDVGVRLEDGHPGPEAPDSVQPETAQRLAIAIECVRYQQFEVMVHDTETAGHDTDNRARLGVDHDGAADDGTVAAEAPLPISITEHDALCAVGDLIAGGQQSTGKRGNPECFKNSAGHKDDVHLLRPSQSGDVGFLRVPRSQRLKGSVVLAEGEVHRGGEWQSLLEGGETLCTWGIQR